MKKKICCCAESVGLLPNCIAKGKDFVLQYSHCIAEIYAGRLRNCIAIHQGVLQVGRACVGWLCIAIHQVYCD